MFFTNKYRLLKQMRYVADQQGIITRYLRESKAWAQHLDNTRNCIIKSAEGKSKNSAAILGSGWLLDVPIEYLCENFKEVYLFDVIHPSQIKHKVSNYKNVKLVETDITGGAIKEFFDVVQMHKSIGKRKELHDFAFNGSFSNLKFDFVASVNIMNQLDILLIDYLKGYNLYSHEELNILRKSIQQKHFNALPKGKTCLVTDYEEQVYSSTNQLEELRPLIHIDLPEKKITDRWQWQFDCHQNYIPEKNVTFNVFSMEL